MSNWQMSSVWRGGVLERGENVRRELESNQPLWILGSSPARRRSHDNVRPVRDQSLRHRRVPRAASVSGRLGTGNRREQLLDDRERPRLADPIRWEQVPFQYLSA